MAMKTGAAIGEFTGIVFDAVAVIVILQRRLDSLLRED